jgi:membrane fusion protein (multidrug efflux system)
MKIFRLLPLFLALSAAALSAENSVGVVLPIKEVSVSSPVLQEVITAVLVEEGDSVKEGDVLIQLRSDREELAVQRTQKQVELAQYRSTGSEKLSREKMISHEKALEDKTTLELAQILHNEAQLALREKTIRAPLSGIVVEKHKEAGETVDRVEKLIDLVNIDQVYVQFTLDSKLLESVRMDQSVKVHFPLIGNAEFIGKVSFIDPRIEKTTGDSFRVKVLIDNPDHKIKAGMRGNAEFARRGAS